MKTWRRKDSDFYIGMNKIVAMHSSKKGMSPSHIWFWSIKITGKLFDLVILKKVYTIHKPYQMKNTTFNLNHQYVNLR